MGRRATIWCGAVWAALGFYRLSPERRAASRDNANIGQQPEREEIWEEIPTFDRFYVLLST